MDFSKKEQPKSNYSKKRFLLWHIPQVMWLTFKYASIGLILFFVGFYFLVQRSVFQDYAAKRAVEILTKSIGSKVDIGHINITFFQKLRIEDLTVYDKKNDTILHCGFLQVSLKGGLFFLLESKIDVNELTLKDVNLNLVEYGPKYNSNFQHIINFFSNGHPDSLFSKPTNKPTNIFFNLKKLNLENVSAKYKNWGDGKAIHFNLKKGDIAVNSFDLEHNVFDINKINLETAYFTQKSIEKITFVDKDVKNPYERFKIKRKPKPELSINIQSFSVQDGQAHIYKDKNQNIVSFSEYFDFQHIDVAAIQLNAINVKIKGSDVNIEKLTHISLETSTPFDIKKLNANQVNVSSKGIKLNKFNLKTDHSELNEDLQLSFNKFSDFNAFVDQVNIKAKFKDATLSLRDIVVFDKKLSSVPIIKQNIKNKFSISGDFKGTINSFLMDDLVIKDVNNNYLSGDFKANQITNHSTATIDLTNLIIETSSDKLAKLIPDLLLPKNLRNIGDIYFQGEHHGHFLDFSNSGTFKTKLGNIKSNFTFNLTHGLENADYSLKAEVDNFKLSALLENNDFENYTGEIEASGKGLTLNKLVSGLSTKTKSFTFKKYTYHDIEIQGNYTSKSFIGKIKSLDPNAFFQANCEVDFSKKIKYLKLDAAIENLDFVKTNLSNIPLRLEGKLNTDIQFEGINDIIGDVFGSKLTIFNQKNEALKIDKLQFQGIRNSDQTINYTLNSDLIDMKLNGIFKLEYLVNDILNALHYNHKKLTHQWSVHGDNTKSFDQSFTFNLALDDSKNLFTFFQMPIDTLTGGTISGSFNNKDSVKYNLILNTNVELITNKNFSLKNVFFEAFGGQNKTEYFLFANQGKFNETKLSQMDLSAELEKDNIHFNIKTPQIENITENLNLDGDYTIYEGMNFIEFNTSKFDFFNDKWSVSDSNYIKFDQNQLEISNLSFSNGVQNVIINSSGEKGIIFEIQKWNARLFNNFTKDLDFNFDGVANLNGSIDDIFNFKGLEVHTTFDSLNVNNFNLGNVIIDGKADSLTDVLNFNLSLNKNEKLLNVVGFYTLPNYKGTKYSNNYLQSSLMADGYPMRFLEVFLGDLVTKSTGNFDASIALKGQIDNLSSNGKIDLKKVATTVNYLGTRYFIPSHQFSLNNTRLDFEDMIILDELGNTAKVSGGIVHNKFKKLVSEIEIESDNFLVLKTTKSQNPIYFGTAICKVNCTMDGPFNLLNIRVDGSTLANTSLTLPVGESYEIGRVNFIEFKNRLDTVVSQELYQVKKTSGLALTMNLEVNENAQMNIIFDEKTDNALRGRGNGIIEIDIPRNSAINMYGGFEIESGSYLFSTGNLFNFSFLKFPFELVKGGTIFWSGDPFDAQVNIEADYVGINTSPYNFIAEYLPSDNSNLRLEASKPTPVKLLMNLKGELFNPNIHFDIQLPIISPELKTYVDNKIQYLNSNYNELISQVGYLLVLKSFLPTSNAISDYGRSAIASTVNSISEIISNQITNMLSPFFNEAIKDSKLISGIDLNLGYNFYDANINSTSGGYQVQSQFGSELLIGPKFSLFNDRVILNTGVKTNSGNTQFGDYIAGDVELQYAITADKRYLVRAYSKSDAKIEGRQTKSGIGLSFNKTADNFSEIFRKKNEKSSKKRDQN